MNTGQLYLAIILVILIGDYLLTLVMEYLNLRNASGDLPKEFEGYYDAEKYRKSQSYLRTNTVFGLVSDTIVLLVTVAFILAGGFNYVDLAARSFGFGTVVTGLIFAGIIMGAAQLLGLPFSVYHTFVIEQKYGFNRTTPKTFVLDLLKGWILGALIGGIAFGAIVWFFKVAGTFAWIYSWGAVIVFLLFVQFIAPVVIMPLFNKFVPLQEGELKHSIEQYAANHGFAMKGVYTMDGSRRSTKSNAYFTGFGRFRRIVLFDTLIAKHTVEELVSVLAHEMGHYKKKHILKFTLSSVLTTGLTFFLLSLFINNEGLFAAFRMQHLSIYASILFFGFLYAPISMILSIVGNILSRKYEYEADAYSASTYGKPEAMITALKKLSVDNLSNLTPHPLKVFLQYSHPPVLERIRAIRGREHHVGD